MSYSVGPVRGASKAIVLAALAEAFDAQVLPSQAIHQHARDAHLANVERQLALLPEPEANQEYVVNMSGWLGYQEGSTVITGSGFGASVSLVDVDKA